MDKLLGVQSQVADFQNMRYDLADAGRLYQDDVGDQHEYSQEVRMRLGTIINLESRLAVSTTLQETEDG